MKRYISIAIIGGFSLFAILFVLQNMEHVSLRLFSGTLEVRAWVVVMVAYVLGAVTGAVLFGALRVAIVDVLQQPPEQASEQDNI